MIVIAENLNTLNRVFMDAVQKKDKRAIGRMAKELVEAGAEMINVQCSLDGADDEKNLPLAVEAVAAATSAGISIDSRNVAALCAAAQFPSKPPLVNYLSAIEPDRTDDLLSFVAESKANLVLRASKGTIPTSVEAKLQIIEDLIEAANEADIPNERLYVDPSVVHIGRGMGQDHILNSHECIRVVGDMIEPPINTVVWISNISTGLPKRLRSRLNSTFLSYLAGAGLDAALVDILDPEIQRTVYLIKSFRDEVIFTPADLSR